MSGKNIFETIKQLKNLPKLPQVLIKLIQACNNDNISNDELTSLISTDPALVTRLMQIIGSAYVNLPKEINSIKSAVVYLGRDTIKNLAISSSAMHIFKLPDSIPEFNINQFWYHSYKCGILAKKIAGTTKDINPDEAFLAGLLHDIGKLVLVKHFPKEYASILKNNSTEFQILTSEKEVFDTDTPEISAWLLKQWNISPIVSDAVLYINEPVELTEGSLTLVKIVFIANMLAITDGSTKIEEITFLNDTSRQNIDEISLEAETEVLDMAKWLNININGSDNLKHEQELELSIKDLSLFYGTLQNLLYANDINSILKVCENGFKILFDVPRMFFFLLDEKKEILSGMCNDNDKSKKIIERLALPLSNKESIIIKSFTNEKIYSSLKSIETQTQAISDTQITRLLETSGIFCLPISSNEKVIGVMVLGVEHYQADDLDANHGIVKLFSKQTGICLQNLEFKNNYTTRLQEKKLEAYTAITEKIIHEINNPVAIITNYIEMLGLKLPDKHPAQKELIVIKEEMNRVSELVENLSSFASPKIENFEPVDINQLYISILGIIKKSILLPKQIETTFDTDPKIPVIKIDKNGLKQVFINLLLNAAQAMDQGGKINITTRFIADSEKIMIDEKRKIPGNIEITIKDNGPGIEKKIYDRLFEPYNSSKNENNKGLGLSIVHSIIKKFKGEISCITQAGKGTSFKIVLPVKSSQRIGINKENH